MEAEESKPEIFGIVIRDLVDIRITKKYPLHKP